MFTRVLKAERCVAKAMVGRAPRGCHYNLAADYKQVTIEAESAAAMADALKVLCGPVRFEVVSNRHGHTVDFVIQWHCPFCLTTVLVLDASVAGRLVDAERCVRNAVADHASANEKCSVPS